jgi:hypothetical protein
MAAALDSHAALLKAPMAVSRVGELSAFPLVRNGVAARSCSAEGELSSMASWTRSRAN